MVQKIDLLLIFLVSSTEQNTSVCLFKYDSLGHEKLVELLIKNGANVSQVDVHKRSPLHYAAENGESKIIDLLIQNGGDPNAKDSSGKTASDIIKSKGKIIFIKRFTNNLIYQYISVH